MFRRDLARREVCILLAAKNGDVFLSEQIASIVGQTHGCWRLYIRVDECSSDRSLEIAERAAAGDERIMLVPPARETMGAGPAFFDALLSAPSESQYFAFCDQDDVWLPKKLERSIQVINALERENRNGPALVHCDLIVTDECLRPIAPSFFRMEGHAPIERNSLAKLLCQNHVTGSACLFNRGLRQLLGELPDDAILHDWWIALVAVALGKISTISEPLLLYRQHARNDTGAKPYSVSRWAKVLAGNPMAEIARARQAVATTRAQARAFSEAYRYELGPEALNLIDSYGSMGQLPFFRRRLRMMQLGLSKPGLIRNLGFYLLA